MLFLCLKQSRERRSFFPLLLFIFCATSSLWSRGRDCRASFVSVTLPSPLVTICLCHTVFQICCFPFLTACPFNAGLFLSSYLESSRRSVEDTVASLTFSFLDFFFYFFFADGNVRESPVIIFGWKLNFDRWVKACLSKFRFLYKSHGFQKLIVRLSYGLIFPQDFRRTFLEKWAITKFHIL